MEYLSSKTPYEHYLYAMWCKAAIASEHDLDITTTASYVGPSRVLAARERESSMTTITLKALLEVLLGMRGTFVLCNAHGSLEFKGEDLYLSAYEEWLTVYHATPKNPESQSHLHLKWHTFQRAVVTHEAGKTPFLAFYGPAEGGDNAPLIWYFPSFYNWANGKTEIAEHRAQYETFVTTYGTTLQLVEPTVLPCPDC
jgi:hypothetical protein